MRYSTLANRRSPERWVNNGSIYVPPIFCGVGGGVSCFSTVNIAPPNSSAVFLRYGYRPIPPLCMSYNYTSFETFFEVSNHVINHNPSGWSWKWKGCSWLWRRRSTRWCSWGWSWRYVTWLWVTLTDHERHYTTVSLTLKQSLCFTKALSTWWWYHHATRTTIYTVQPLAR